MKLGFIGTLLIIVALSSCGDRGREWAIQNPYDSSSISSEDFPEAIRLSEKLVREATRLNGPPGAQIAVAVNGKMCWSSNLGYADLGTKTVVNNHTLFRIASTSKIMTAVAVGKLVESGQLDLDKPIVEYLPELPVHYAGITTRHLVSHQSGIRHYYGADVSEKNKYYDDVTDAFPLFVNAPLIFPPGTRSEYSSYGWLIVSAVVQRVSGKPFLQFLQNEVWTPAGMNDTFGNIPQSRQGDVTHFYIRNANQNRWREAPYQDLSYNWGGSGISSNANDLVALGNALLSGSLLKPKTLRKMFDQQFTSANDSTGFGIGFIQYEVDHQVAVGHSGLMPTARSYLFLFPQKKMVIAYTANSAMANFSDENLMLIVDLFSRETDNKKYTDSVAIGGWVRPWQIELETADGRYEPAKLSFYAEGNKLSGQLTFDDSVARYFDVVKFTRDSIQFACVLPSHTAWIELHQQNQTLSGKSYFKKPLHHSLLKSFKSEPELRRLVTPKNIRNKSK